MPTRNGQRQVTTQLNKKQRLTITVKEDEVEFKLSYRDSRGEAIILFPTEPGRARLIGKWLQVNIKQRRK